MDGPELLGDGEDGALFQFLNASKRGAIADVATTEGRDVVRALIEHADVVERP